MPISITRSLKEGAPCHLFHFHNEERDFTAWIYQPNDYKFQKTTSASALDKKDPKNVLFVLCLSVDRWLKTDPLNEAQSELEAASLQERS